MTQNEQILWSLRGIIATATDEQQQRIRDCTANVRDLLSEYGDEGKLAIALVTLELALESEHANARADREHR